MVKKQFDLIVIGGGTGGLRLAYQHACKGKTTALIEPAELGGTCLNHGCIPTKAMLHAAELYTQIKEAKKFGIETTKPHINFTKLMERVQNIVRTGQDHIHDALTHKKLTLYRGRAHFTGTQTVQTGNTTLNGKHIVISTGSQPRIPTITGLAATGYYTSKDILHIQKLPKTIGIIGAGYIALEFATFFNKLGVHVTVIGRAPRILRAIDKEISTNLQKRYEQQGITFITSAAVIATKKKTFGKEIYYETKKGMIEKVRVQEILLATGRIPNTQGLNLKAAKIITDKKGAINTNQYLQTNNKNIYALGDVTGKTMFAHAAKKASNIVLHNITQKKKQTMPSNNVPWAVFTSPPIAGTGTNETELQKNKTPYETIEAPYNKTGRAEIIGNTKGKAKIYYHKKTKKILGATINGPRADDLIHEIHALKTKNATIKELQNIIHIHPTLSEIHGNYNWPE